MISNHTTLQFQKIVLFFIFCLFLIQGTAQKTKKARTIDDRFFGIQVKPIIPINYFGMEPILLEDTIASFGIYNKASYSMGMVMRRNFTDKLSLETGINYVRRNFLITSYESARDTSDRSKFGFVNYEIPVQFLIYIRLSKELFMNVSSGFAFNFYASSVQSSGENFLIQHLSLKKYWMFPSFLTNLGFEYRTPKKGSFYIGASLVNPFDVIMESRINYYYTNNLFRQYSTNIKGSYFTVDLRYFFANVSKKAPLN
mgnify:CR=1 FL=1